MLVATLYGLWLLPLPTYIALTTDEWEKVTVTLRPDFFSSAIPGILGLPGEFQDAVQLRVNATSFQLFDAVYPEDLFTREGATKESIWFRTSRAQPILVCWPRWMQIDRKDKLAVVEREERICLRDVAEEPVLFRGNIRHMVPKLGADPQPGFGSYAFIPFNSEVTLHRHAESDDWQLQIVSFEGMAITMGMAELESIEIFLDVHGAPKGLFLDATEMVDELRSHVPQLNVEMGRETHKMVGDKEIAEVHGFGDHLTIYFDPKDSSKRFGLAYVAGSLGGVVDVIDKLRFQTGLAISTFASAEIRGQMKFGRAQEEIDELDTVFMGGAALRMEIDEDGRLRVYGEATHVAVNDHLSWKAMGGFVPSELWAALLSSAVTLLVAVPFVRGVGGSGE